LGERAHLATPTVDLSTHVTDVQMVIAAEELNDVILVGHSYAGHVLPLVADRLKPRLRHLVYLDCVMPTEGKAFLAPEVGAARAKTADRGFLLTPPDLAFFGVPADHPDADWVRRRLTPHPLPTLTEVVRFRNGGDTGIPKTYIRCLQRRDMSAPDPDEPKLRGKPEWTWATIDTGHDAMVTKPKDLAEMLRKIG
jgi:pimeloyl-ACP methyl ester carboxylesterase